MKVKIKDLKPNPFRRLKTYPIDEARVERLRQSIKHTGFWDNIVGRISPSDKRGYYDGLDVNGVYVGRFNRDREAIEITEGGEVAVWQWHGKVEIAYGHHRLIALQKEYSKDYEVDVILKPLDDARMIQVMADENDDLYKTTPAIINETVRVARDYIREHPREKYPIVRKIPDKRRLSPECKKITEFLNWEYWKIECALAALQDMENDLIVNQEYEKFKTQSQAEEFRQARKKYPEVSDERARKIAKDVREENLTIKDIKPAFKDDKFKKEKQKPDYLDFLIQLIPEVRDLARKLDEVVKFKRHIQGEKGYRFLRALEGLTEVVKKFKGGNEDGKEKKKNTRVVEENRRLLGTARR